MKPEQQSLFDLIDKINATTPDSGLVYYEDQPDTICQHRHQVGKNGSGWTLEHDPDSPYVGRWVDSNPNCRRPGYQKD